MLHNLFPSVLLTAILAGPIYASIVGIGSAGLADALFMGPRYQLFESPMDSFGDISSLISFALIIGCVLLFRKVIAQHSGRRIKAESESGIYLASKRSCAGEFGPEPGGLPSGWDPRMRSQNNTRLPRTTRTGQNASPSGQEDR